MSAAKRPWRPAQRSPLSKHPSDFYETPSCCVDALLGQTSELELRGLIWESAAGKGAISRRLKAAGHKVLASDLVAHPGADAGIQTPVDFFELREPPPGASVIVTNPPYGLADLFIRHGLFSLGLPVIVLLRLQAIEGARRSDLIDGHLRRVWAGRQRLPMMHRQDWQGPRTAFGGAPFAWFCFEPDLRTEPFFEMRRINWRSANCERPGPSIPAARM
jgi:hypothetical protein